MLRRFSSLACLALSLCAARAAADQARPQLGVEIVACDAPDDIRRVVGLELDAMVAPSVVLPPHATRVLARCDADAAALEVTDPLTSKVVTRVVDLSKVDARARPRVISIAIAELVSASWFELEHAPAPRRPLEPVIAKRERAAALAAVRKREHVWQLRAGLGAAMLVEPAVGKSTFGGSLLLTAESPWGYALVFDVTGTHNGSDYAEGTVTRSIATFGAKLMVPFLDAIDLRAGGGFRAGGARIAGETRDRMVARDGEVSGAVFALVVGLSGAVELTDTVALQLLYESGGALASVHGKIDGETVAAIGPLWSLLMLSVHVEL